MNKKIFKIFINMLLILSIVFVGYKMYINKNTQDISGIYNREFKEHVVFYPQHQDDEILWGGSAIINAINQCGSDNVYVVLVSDGSGVNVFKNNKKYKNLTRKEKKELRNNEFKDALKQIGVKQENIIVLADVAKTEGTHYDLMEKTILGFENKLGNVTQIAHHYECDDHIMHKKNGQVLKTLADENKVKDALYFVKPQYIKDIPQKDRVIYKVNNTQEYDKLKKACYEYKVVDKKNNKFGIGYTSAHSYFDNLLKDPKLTSVLSLY